MSWTVYRFVGVLCVLGGKRKNPIKFSVVVDEFDKHYIALLN